MPWLALTCPGRSWPLSHEDWRRARLPPPLPSPSRGALCNGEMLLRVAAYSGGSKGSPCVPPLYATAATAAALRQGNRIQPIQPRFKSWQIPVAAANPVPLVFCCSCLPHPPSSPAFSSFRRPSRRRLAGLVAKVECLGETQLLMGTFNSPRYCSLRVRVIPRSVRDISFPPTYALQTPHTAGRLENKHRVRSEARREAPRGQGKKKP